MNIWSLALWCGALCSATPPAGDGRPHLSQAGWLPRNARALEDAMAAHGRRSRGYDAARPPLATFDWDNTMMRQDMGDATMVAMLRRGLVRVPARRDWGKFHAALSPAARAALNRACDAAGAPGERLRTDLVPACAEELVSVVWDKRTTAGAPAFAVPDSDGIHQPYAFQALLLAGMTPQEVYALAREVHREAEAAPVGAQVPVGARHAPAWVRIYPQMRELAMRLAEEGFEVWVVSASQQAVVEAVAEQVGVPRGRVIGVRLRTDPSGRYLPELEDCGGLPTGALITYGTGKRCFIHKIILGRPQAEQLRPPTASQRRVVLAAGDSDGDLAMVGDAAVHLVINRNRTGLMCRALHNTDGHWLIQPSFLEPLPRRAEAYSCGNLRTALGEVLPDIGEDAAVVP